MKWRVLITPRSSFSPQTSGNRREIPDTRRVVRQREATRLQELWLDPSPHLLLAMQKVEGSNPFSRFPGDRL